MRKLTPLTRWRIPSGPEANPLQQKAGYVYATFLCRSIKLYPCKARRTIYVPGIPGVGVQVSLSHGSYVHTPWGLGKLPIDIFVGSKKLVWADCTDDH